MQNLYEEFFIVDKEIVHLHGLQHKCNYVFKTPKVVQETIITLHEWSMRYKGAHLTWARKQINE